VPELESVAAALGHAYVLGMPVNWAAVISARTDRPAKRVDLPTYAFQRTRYWLDAPTTWGATAGAVVPMDEVAETNVPAAPDPAIVLREQLAGASRDEQSALLVELVRLHTAGVLGHTDLDAVPADASLLDLGLSSLTTLELVTRLTDSTGATLSAAVILDNPSPAMLAAHLLADLTPERV
jgi:acyl transferase domain-containing protein